MMRARGHVDIGISLAIMLIIIAFAVSHLKGWWDTWEWWGGKGLFVLGAIALYIAGAAFENARQWPKYDEAPPEEKKQ